jgi:ABC-type amino acid transport substrate-binding protein
MKIINLYGQPGAGKSTMAAGLFHKMKLRGYKVELVTEYAKDLTYEQNFKKLDNQIYVFAKQHQRIKRLEESGVDYIITDSPLLLSLIYGEPNAKLHDLVRYENYKFFNLNFYVERTKEYVPIGRSQTEEESDKIGEKLLKLLEAESAYFLKVKGDENAVENILKFI